MSIYLIKGDIAKSNCKYICVADVDGYLSAVQGMNQFGE